MKADDENNEWKAEVPYLAALPVENPFVVPENYFDTLPEAITHSVYLSGLKEVNAGSGYAVPDQYFSALKDRILAQTTEEEFDADKVAKQFPVSSGFHTPDQYFQQLQSKILAQTTAEALPVKESKIVRLWHSGLLKYASAACFVLVAAFGFYLNQQSFKPAAATSAEIANEQMLYDMDEQDIIDHVEGNAADDPSDKASNAELETYILSHYSQSDLSSEL